jgi:hypothetical protein
MPCSVASLETTADPIWPVPPISSIVIGASYVSIARRDELTLAFPVLIRRPDRRDRRALD